MKNWLFLLTNACVALLISCKSKNQIQSPHHMTESAPASVEKPACKPMILQSFQSIEDSGTYQMATPLEVVQDGLCLRIRYQYSGCKEGPAILVWNGFLIKSYPPQANLVLYTHDTGQCDRLLDGFDEFDLSRFAEATDSLVILRIRDYSERVFFRLK